MPNSKIPHVSLNDTFNLHRTRFNQLIDSVGDLALLETDVTSTIVGSINSIDSNLGERLDLTTTDKTDIVSAINENNSRLDSINFSELVTPRVYAQDSSVTNYFNGNVQMQSNLDVQKNVQVDGNLVANGNVDLGNATSDTISMTGRVDTDIVPSTDNARDLGSSSLEFRNLYVDGIGYIDSVQADNINVGSNVTLGGDLVVGDSARIGGAFSVGTTANIGTNLRVGNDLYVVDSAYIGGDASIGATLNVSTDARVGGSLSVEGNTTLGTNATNNVVFNADVNSAIIPNTDNSFDLGSTTQEWRHLFIDGTVNADNVAADSATVSNTLTVNGLLKANGNVDLGDATTDTISMTGRVDTDIVPSTDNARDLGSSSLEFRNLYVDGIGYIDSVDADNIRVSGDARIEGNLDVHDSSHFLSNLAVNGNLTVGGNTTMSGTLIVDGEVTFKAGANSNINLGDANTDNVVFNADVKSSIIPNTDNTYDLGSSSQEWRHVYIDGTASIDNVAADSATIGTLKVSDLTNNRVLIAGANGEVEDDTNFTFNGTNLTVGNTSINRLAVGINTTGLEADSATITGDLDVQGLTTLDSTTVDGTLTVTDSATFSSKVLIENDLRVEDSATITGNLRVVGNITSDSRAFYIQADSAGTDQVNFGETIRVRGGEGIDVNRDGSNGWHVVAEKATSSNLGVATFNTANFSVSAAGDVTIKNGGVANAELVNSSITFADSNSSQSVALGDTVTFRGAAGEIEVNHVGSTFYFGLPTDVDIDGSLSIGSNFSVGGNLIITGTQKVSGQFTNYLSEIDSADSPTLDAGITVRRGNQDSAELIWDEANNYWVVGTTTDRAKIARHGDAVAFDSAAITGTLTVSDSANISGNLTVGGDFIVRGTTTTVNSTTVSIGDNIILLNDSLNGSGIANAVNAGIEVERGTLTNAQLLWNETSDRWTVAGATSGTLAYTSEIGNATITLSAGTDLSTGGNFTTNASSNKTVTFNHAAVSSTQTHQNVTLSSGSDFYTIDSATVSTTGHLTNVKVTKYTLPALDNYSSWTIKDSDTTTYTVTSGDTLQIQGKDGKITSSFINDDVLEISHEKVTVTQTHNGNTSLSYGGAFTVLDSATYDAWGHVTGFKTKQLTLPSADDTNTTYTFDAVTSGVSGSGAILRLDPSTGSNMDVLLKAGAGISIARDSNNQISIANTGIGTTYDLYAVTTPSGAILRLDPSAGTNDDILLRSTKDIAISYDSNQGIIINHGDTSTQSSSTNTGRTYIQSIGLDSMGHVTSLSTATETVTDTNQLTVWYIEDSAGTEKTMNHNKELKVWGDQHHISTAWGSGTGTNASPYDLKISHKPASGNSSIGAQTLAYGGTFTVMTSALIDAAGHVDSARSMTFTLPSADDTNTTYTFDAVASAAGAILRLDPSTGTNMDVLLKAGTNVSIARDSNNQITINSSYTDTNQLTVWYIEDSDGTEMTMDHNKELKILGDNNHITTNFGSGAGTNASPYDLKISHTLSSAVGRTIGGSISSGGSFSAVTGITFDEAGHIDSVQTTNFGIFANTNTTYTASTGLTLTGTAFSISNGGVDTTQIAADAVTYAKMQNVATANRVLGSTTAGGAVSEVQINQSMIANDAVGSAELKTVVTFSVKNSAGTALKTLYGAGA